MRGKGITSGRRPVRPDGSHYRESRRRSLSGGGGRRLRVGITWVALAAGVIAVVLVVTWVLR